ncbi:hypothetical protein JKF63_03970 [Porcisia hertigi]|uniref:Calreticulin n=1 Tax=Porcisia hertigi TaxID=2761500 RepID=A0A836L487_9TRYP|nr:hypothetical protein JKF63_03970 [Porcisia hertigi]
MRRTVLAAIAGLLALCVCFAHAEIFFHEEFNSLDGWVQSEHKSDYGKVELSSGAIHVDAAKQQGLKLTQDEKFYAISKKLPTPVSNDGKPLVVSFSVRNEQDLQCGGTYLKFFSELNQKDFNGESPYWLMFGPDRCGSSRRVHIILNHNGENHLWKNMHIPKEGRATHAYTLEIAPNNTYQLYVDGEYATSGSLEEEWDMVPPKTIADPNEKKPSDWVDEAMIPDPSFTKPEDWDKEPATIPDAEAVKPEDWDDAEDGKWEPPQIPNPKYPGEWKPRLMKNPAYKGPWAAQQIPNPAYKEDPNLYRASAPLQYVGIDVLQVQAGSIFDNIVIGDNLQEVLKVVESTYGAIAKEERELLDAKAKEKDEAEAKAEAEEHKEQAGDSDDKGANDEEDL